MTQCQEDSSAASKIIVLLFSILTVVCCLQQHLPYFPPCEVSEHTLVSMSPVFVTGYAASSQATLLCCVSAGELGEICDRGPLLLQNIHCSRTTLLILNVTQTAGDADSLA